MLSCNKVIAVDKNIMPKTHKGVTIVLQKHFVTKELPDENMAHSTADCGMNE